MVYTLRQPSCTILLQPPISGLPPQKALLKNTLHFEAPACTIYPTTTNLWLRPQKSTFLLPLTCTEHQPLDGPYQILPKMCPLPQIFCVLISLLVLVKAFIFALYCSPNYNCAEPSAKFQQLKTIFQFQLTRCMNSERLDGMISKQLHTNCRQF